MIDLGKDITIFVVVEKVSCDLRPLRHPVQPQAAGSPATINMITADDGINRTVEFDAGHLRAAPDALLIDIMDLIVF